MGSAVKGNSSVQSLSPDGSTAIIRSSSTLTEDDTDSGANDLFAVDMASGEKTLLTGSISGGFDGVSDLIWFWTASNNPELRGKWSTDGQSILIVTTSTMVADDLDDGGIDLYSVDVHSGEKILADLGIDQAEEYDNVWGDAAAAPNSTNFFVTGYDQTTGTQDLYWVSAIL